MPFNVVAPPLVTERFYPTAVRGDLGALTACATVDIDGQQSLPATVMKVMTPTAAQQEKGIKYVASVVPPMTGLDGCTTEVYELTSLQARVLVMPEPLTDTRMPDPTATAAVTTP